MRNSEYASRLRGDAFDSKGETVMLLTSEEKRKDVRSNFHYYIEYVLHPETSDETFDGAIIDISGSGLCICGCTSLKEGQEIAIKSNLPHLCRTATVLWVNQLHDTLYKAGIMFKECLPSKHPTVSGM
jgi:hypothetical protein